MPDLILADVVNQYRTYDAGGGPSRQQASVNRPHLHSAEEVAEVGGNRREASAVHAYDDAKAQHVQGHRADPARLRRKGVQGRSKEEEDGVSTLTANSIGQGGPGKSADHIEQAQQTDEAGRHVQEKDGPQ